MPRWSRSWKRLAADLVARGLWEPAERDGAQGWQFVNWTEYQPASDEPESFQTKPVTQTQRLRILERDASTCRACGATGAEALLEIDHIIARINGGSNDDSNLQVLCRPCNRKKGAR